MSVLAGFKSAVDACLVSAAGTGVGTLDADNIGRTPAASVGIADADCAEPV